MLEKLFGGKEDERWSPEQDIWDKILGNKYRIKDLEEKIKKDNKKMSAEIEKKETIEKVETNRQILLVGIENVRKVEKLLNDSNERIENILSSLKNNKKIFNNIQEELIVVNRDISIINSSIESIQEQVKEIEDTNSLEEINQRIDSLEELSKKQPVEESDIKLTDKQRQVLELRREGMSLTDIGKEMNGITFQAVSNTLKTIRKKGISVS